MQKKIRRQFALSSYFLNLHRIQKIHFFIYLSEKVIYFVKNNLWFVGKNKISF